VSLSMDVLRPKLPGHVKKGKVDNLYRGSIIDSIAAEPLLQYPLVHWTHAIGCHMQAH